MELSVVILPKHCCFNLQICLKCWIKMYNISKISYMWSQFDMLRKDDEITNYLNITFMKGFAFTSYILFSQILAALQNWLACQGKTIVQEHLCCHSVSPHLYEQYRIQANVPDANDQKLAFCLLPAFDHFDWFKTFKQSTMLYSPIR